MAVLGIETSCDDTGIAICSKGKILYSSLSSQEDLHREFGGIVPEIASRKHLEVLPVMLHRLKENFPFEKISGIAVTKGPGLIGSLLVGVKMAEGLSMGLGIPLVGVDHLMAHAVAIKLEEDIPFPYIALLVSGGHTSIMLVKDYTDMEILGETRDDACGEAFDKVAKMMGLGYPGGPVIEERAKLGKPTLKLPIPDLGSSLDFSFSGLKTAVMKKIMKLSPLDDVKVNNISKSFQDTVSAILREKTAMAVKETGIKHVVFCGGVAANRTLRKDLETEGKKKGFKVFSPSPHLCTDNGDMIAFLGEIMLEGGLLENPPLSPYPN